MAPPTHEATRLSGLIYPPLPFNYRGSSFEAREKLSRGWLVETMIVAVMTMATANPAQILW
jgi:hypothetical protein